MACLQETHLIESEAIKLGKKWKGQLYAASYSAYARGTLIWIAPGVPYKLQYAEMDIQGRYVMIQGTLDGKDLTLLNSYGPNVDDRDFFPQMQDLLAAEISSTLIWVGDHNCILDGQTDRDPPKLNTKP